MTQNSENDTRAPLTMKSEAVDLCERLHDAAARMTDLMAEETVLLKANRPSEAAALQIEKAELAKIYARDYGILKANAQFVGASAPTQTDRLRRALKHLQIQAHSNFSALEAARAVSEGLLNAIFEIAKGKRSGPSCYTGGAQMAEQRPTAPTALAIDRSL